MKRIISIALALGLFGALAHAESITVADPVVMKQALQTAQTMSPGEAVNLRLRLVLAWLAKLNLEKSHFISESLGVSNPGVYSVSIGIPNYLAEMFASYKSLGLLDSGTRWLYSREVREFVNQMSDTSKLIMSTQKEIEKRMGAKMINTWEVKDLVARLAESKRTMAGLLERRPTVMSSPWTKFVRAGRYSVATVIGLGFVVDSVSSSIEVTTNSPEQLTATISHLDDFIVDTNATLAVYSQLE
jgi:hypothetical protein